MAVYEIFSHSVKYQYKSTICSSATLFILFITIFMVIAPFLLVYRSNGFWLRTANYREQPEVHFKHQYILIVETDQINNPILCSTFPHLNDAMNNDDHCAIVKSRELDYDDDGKKDELSLEFFLHVGQRSVYSIKLFLLFDYKLHIVSSLQMESLAYFHYSAGTPGASLEVVADLHLVQRKILNTYGRNLIYNTSIFNQQNLEKIPLNFGAILREYTKRDVSTVLSNIYPLWTVGILSDSPFVFTATIHYPEENLTYRPRFWQIVKWAWIQYVSVLLIFLYLFKTIKIYIFHNRIISSIKIIPWKKSF